MILRRHRLFQILDAGLKPKITSSSTVGQWTPGRQVIKQFGSAHIAGWSAARVPGPTRSTCSRREIARLHQLQSNMPPRRPDMLPKLSSMDASSPSRRVCLSPAARSVGECRQFCHRLFPHSSAANRIFANLLAKLRVCLHLRRTLTEVTGQPWDRLMRMRLYRQSLAAGSGLCSGAACCHPINLWTGEAGPVACLMAHAR